MGEEINQIKKYLREALTELQDEITSGKFLSEDRHNGLTSQINIFESETNTLRDKMAELEPYTEGINTKVAELSNNVQEKITFMTEMSQEQRMLLERTTESISEYSEKFVSIERDHKDFRDNINKQSKEDIEAFRSEVENKIAQLFTKSDANDDEMKYLGVRVTGVNDMVIDIEDKK